MAKSLSKSCYRVTLGSGSLRQELQGNGLFLYTVITFLIVLALYLTTKDWKGFTAPEEVDLGSLRVPSRTYRRKYKHRHRDH